MVKHVTEELWIPECNVSHFILEQKDLLCTVNDILASTAPAPWCIWKCGPVKKLKESSREVVTADVQIVGQGGGRNKDKETHVLATNSCQLHRHSEVTVLYQNVKDGVGKN